MQTISVNLNAQTKGNPGVGGYGIVVHTEDQRKTFSGHAMKTDCCTMVLLAAIKALKGLKKFAKREDVYIHVYANNFLVSGMNSYIKGWKERNWYTINGEALRLWEMWKELDDLRNQFKHITFQVLSFDTQQMKVAKELASLEVKGNSTPPEFVPRDMDKEVRFQELINELSTMGEVHGHLMYRSLAYTI